MALYTLVYDSSTKQKKYVAYPGFYDYVESVTGSPKTVFDVGMDIDAVHKIDVEIDGRGQPIENTHWTRDVEANTVTTSETVQVGSVFKARIYLK